jgi:deoxyribodipyrimidine photo-lyase
MVVRKELSDNFCYYNDNYDSLQGAPAWALASLSKHANDERQYLYSKEQFENAQTHDQAWNAAQIQLRKQGKIHGYMRMYWAKKVLEWSTSADEAFKTLVYLNDFYSLDGGDPNGYVGILWSVAGLHDRPWGERSVYGTIRCMVYDGLRRKFPIEEYIRQQGTL